MSEDIKCKVIVVGDSGVGKTTLISRLIDRFDENASSTFGVSYVSKDLEIEGTIIKFDIWDTAGQEKYHSLNRLFYNETKICIIVYDITNKQSYQNVKDYWYKEITNEISDKIIFGLAGNKSDLYSKEEVKEEDARNYAREKNMFYSLISCYQNTGVDDFFNKLGKEYLKLIMKDNFKNENIQKSKIVLNSVIKDNGKRNEHHNCC
jgi:Ras-related protein Rab-5C